MSMGEAWSQVFYIEEPIPWVHFYSCNNVIQGTFIGLFIWNNKLTMCWIGSINQQITEPV